MWVCEPSCPAAPAARSRSAAHDSGWPVVGEGAGPVDEVGGHVAGSPGCRGAARMGAATSARSRVPSSKVTTTGSRTGARSRRGGRARPAGRGRGRAWSTRPTRPAPPSARRTASVGQVDLDRAGAPDAVVDEHDDPATRRARRDRPARPRPSPAVGDARRRPGLGRGRRSSAPRRYPSDSVQQPAARRSATTSSANRSRQRCRGGGAHGGRRPTTGRPSTSASAAASSTATARRPARRSRRRPPPRRCRPRRWPRPAGRPARPRWPPPGCPRSGWAGPGRRPRPADGAGSASGPIRCTRPGADLARPAPPARRGQGSGAGHDQLGVGQVGHGVDGQQRILLAPSAPR